MNGSKSVWILVAGFVVIAILGYFVFMVPKPSTSDQFYGDSDSGNPRIPLSTGGTAVPKGAQQITLKTNVGEITFETYVSDAPKTVENFITLANKGFYNGLTFHRVINGFMIQGGDPNCSPDRATGPCGTGGPGYRFEDELNPDTASYKAGYKKGVVAMANAGPDTNGSQFFIMLENYPLPNNYTIFGKVVKGQEVVDKIGGVDTGENDRPLSPVVIERVTVEQSQ